MPKKQLEEELIGLTESNIHNFKMKQYKELSDALYKEQTPVTGISSYVRGHPPISKEFDGKFLD